VANEVSYCTDVILHGLGECQRAAHEPRDPLSERGIEPFDVLGFPGELMDGFVLGSGKKGRDRLPASCRWGRSGRGGVSMKVTFCDLKKDISALASRTACSQCHLGEDARRKSDIRRGARSPRTRIGAKNRGPSDR